MKSVVFGYHLMGCIGLEALVRNGFEVTALFTHRDATGEQAWWPSIVERSVELGIPVCYSDEHGGDALAGNVASYEPEMIFSFYYRDLLPTAVLNLAPRGGFNLHGSLLPDGRGRAPVNWTLVRGLKQTGVTLHRMVKKADAGDVIDQEAVAVDACETAYSLYLKLGRAAELLLDRSLPALEDGSYVGKPMDMSKGTYFGRRTPADGLLDWTKPATELYNLIRAVTHPYPGAFAPWQQRRLLVWWAFPLEESLPDYDPGYVTRVGLEGIDVATGSGLLRITAVQPEGEPQMPACTFARQYGITAGSRLE